MAADTLAGVAFMTDDRAGLLVVRSRIIDVATTVSVSAVMLYVAWTINPLGTA